MNHQQAYKSSDKISGGRRLSHILCEPSLYQQVEDVDRIVVELINHRRKALVRNFRETHSVPVLDSYHGEMGFPLHPDAAAAVVQTTKSLVETTHPLSEPDGALFSKEQPAILQRLAAERVFDRFQSAPPSHGFPARTVQADEVLVIPYSALAMFEAVMGALATEMPGGVVLCPAGFYKEYHQHIQKFGLQLEQFDTDIWSNCKINPAVLRQAIRRTRQAGSQVAAIGLTIPGNPLIAEYSADDLRDLGAVLVTEDVRVVVDASFDKIVPPYPPLGSVVIEIDGVTHALYDRVMTVGGISKSHMAFGPLKIGVACCGDSNWRAAVKMQSTLTFQRETTALAATVLEATPMSYVQQANIDFAEKLSAAVTWIETANQKRQHPVLQIIGEARYGPFLTLSLMPDLLEKAGIRRGHELSEMVIMECGIDNVSGDRVGFRHPCIRLNVHCPRISAKKDPTLTPLLLERLLAMADRIQAGSLTYRSSLSCLPLNLQRRLKRFRLACLSPQGFECCQMLPKQIEWEPWSLSQFGIASPLVHQAPSLRDLTHAVHGVVMSASDVRNHLVAWLSACKAGCVAMIETMEAIDHLSAETLENAQERGILFVPFNDVLTDLESAEVSDVPATVGKVQPGLTYV